MKKRISYHGGYDDHSWRARQYKIIADNVYKGKFKENMHGILPRGEALPS